MGVRVDNSTAYEHADEPNLLNLHKAMEYDNLGQPVLRVKAAFGGGYGNTAYNANPATDAFGRLRISNPVTLFDSQHRYKDNGKFSRVVHGNATVAHDANASLITSTVTSTSGDYVYAESKRVFPYQPGKSQLTMITFQSDGIKANVRQRVGYFGVNNGIFFQANSSQVSFVKRSHSTGTVTDNVVNQSSWNIDTLDGSSDANNPSGVHLDISKSQIWWTDIEWLGVGSVRTGFVINGQFYPCHVFHHANQSTLTYMTTACLPIRAEIENLGPTAGNTSLRTICSTVISEGGYEAKTGLKTATRTTAIAATGAASGWAPVVSIRLAPGREDSVVIPDGTFLVGDGNGSIYEWAFIRNANVSGGLWQTISAGDNVQFNNNAASMSGGTVEETGMFTSTNQSSPVSKSTGAYSWDLQLGRDQTPTSDTMTLAVRYIVLSGGGGNCYGSISWYDLI